MSTFLILLWATGYALIHESKQEQSDIWASAEFSTGAILILISIFIAGVSA